MSRSMLSWPRIRLPPGAEPMRPMPLRKISVNPSRRSYADMFSWIAPAMLLVLPATRAPLGLTSAGLPANVQILGAAFQDKSLIKFAELHAQVMGGFTRPPLCQH